MRALDMHFLVFVRSPDLGTLPSSRFDCLLHLPALANLLTLCQTPMQPYQYEFE